MGENTQRKSKRSRNRKKRQTATITANATTNKDRERTVNLPRLDAVEKVPSNAPTMAIAPSDYEHIFHENVGPAQGPSAPATIARPTPPPMPVQLPAAPVSPPATPPYVPPSPPPTTAARAHNQPDDYNPNQFYNYNTNQRQHYNADFQVTLDGYTLMGSEPAEPGRRRTALPAYIVRASNQFSRAALSRVAKYLASRA